MTGLELLGWLGGILFAGCAIPQAYKSYKEGHSLGISWGLLIMWGLGEVFTLLYVIPKLDFPLIINYTCNLLSCSVIAWFKLFPRVSSIFTNGNKETMEML